MAESCGKLPLIDDEILSECVASAIHKGNREEKGTLIRHEQETKMTVNVFSKESIQGLNTELCSLIQLLLKYDSKNRNTKERKLFENENFQETEKKDTEPLDILRKRFLEYTVKINPRATAGNNLLGDQDTSCSSKSQETERKDTEPLDILRKRFVEYKNLDARYSKCRSEVSASFKQKGKCMRMPYSVPLCRKSSSDGVSSGKRERFKAGRNIQSLYSVSDHQQSNSTSKYNFNKKSTNNNDIDVHGRSREDHIQELIFKIYSEQQTLEELLRCKTEGRYKTCNPPSHSRDILNQSLFGASSPPRFVQNCVFNAIAKPDISLKIPDLFKVPEDGSCKEELFDALQVPYFEEKRGVAKQLDELFSTKWSNRINFL